MRPRSSPTSTRWKWAIADTYDLGPVPAFVARWWIEYAIARDPKLDAHLHDLEHRAAESTDIAEARVLLDEASKIRHQAVRTEPGESPTGSWGRLGRWTGGSMLSLPATHCPTTSARSSMPCEPNWSR
ncbi:hypothetical protein [Streptomyces sp. NPDC101455]|uniref:hypothetical protein n=1 Tax=Streptomyces sp. NPDC101455 TaxID=3366142 RepID=UPI00382F426E